MSINIKTFEIILKKIYYDSKIHAQLKLFKWGEYNQIISQNYQFKNNVL